MPEDTAYTHSATSNATSRFYMGIPIEQPTGGTNDGDGSDAAVCVVHRLSYGRNLIPTSNHATLSVRPWDAVLSRVCNNGKSYPNFTDYNTNLKSGWVGLGTTYTRQLSEVVDPADTIHIVDAMAGGSTAADKVGGTAYGASMRGLQYDIRTDMFPDDEASKVAPRHGGGFVILWGDGHSSWKKFGSTNPCQWTIQDDVCN